MKLESHARKIFGDEKFSTLSFHVFEAAAAGEICDQFKVDLWRLNSLLLNIVCIAYLDALNLKFFMKFFLEKKMICVEKVHPMHTNENVNFQPSKSCNKFPTNR